MGLVGRETGADGHTRAPPGLVTCPDDWSHSSNHVLGTQESVYTLQFRSKKKALEGDGDLMSRVGVPWGITQ